MGNGELVDLASVLCVKALNFKKFLTTRITEHNMSVARLGLQATILQALFQHFFLEHCFQIPHLPPLKIFQYVSVPLKVCLIDHRVTQHIAHWAQGTQHCYLLWSR